MGRSFLRVGGCYCRLFLWSNFYCPILGPSQTRPRSKGHAAIATTRSLPSRRFAWHRQASHRRARSRFRFITRDRTRLYVLRTPYVRGHSFILLLLLNPRFCLRLRRTPQRRTACFRHCLGSFIMEYFTSHSRRPGGGAGGDAGKGFQ